MAIVKITNELIEQSMVLDILNDYFHSFYLIDEIHPRLQIFRANGQGVPLGDIEIDILFKSSETETWIDKITWYDPDRERCMDLIINNPKKYLI